MAGWGVTDRRTARRAEIEWPDQDGRASYDDIWTWQDVHVKFAEQLEQSHPTEAALINATRAPTPTGWPPICPIWRCGCWKCRENC